jgi:hypothetical protein
MFTNHYGRAVTKHLQGNHVIVHSADWQQCYSHHPQILSHQGKLLATWSIGNVHEDGPGQRMVLATSSDEGLTWSEPAVVAAPVPGQYKPTCITSGGLLVSDEGITAFYSSFDFTLEGFLTYYESGANRREHTRKPCTQDVHVGVLFSQDGGNSWQDTGTRVPGVIVNVGVTRLSSGRLILQSHRTLAYCDQALGLGPWKVTGLPGLPEGFYEGASGYRPLTAEWRHLGVCENCVHEVPGEPLRIMLRTAKGRLAVAESPDQGATWGEPRLTDFTDCGSRMQFGRLPDGRFFALSCPNADQPQALLRRTPLVLAVSEDGHVFDRHFVVGSEPDRPLRFPGAYKHGRYGYPYAHCMNGKLFVVNSVGKEDIECHIFDLKDID